MLDIVFSVAMQFENSGKWYKMLWSYSCS